MKVVVDAKLLEDTLDIVASDARFLDKTQATIKLMQSLEKIQENSKESIEDESK